MIPLFLLLSYDRFYLERMQRKRPSIRRTNPTYHEKYRPQFHFTPPNHWMNDPNGMVLVNGEYHLFYQAYPHSSVWGPMHWGHAISSDLINWKHLPLALYPDSKGYIFSGSAVYDINNTSGFGTLENPPIIAFFTHHNAEIEQRGGIDVESQSIAYSLDNGYTFIKYENNPIIKNPGIKDFRDPKVVYDKKHNKWIMCIAAHDVVRFYESFNLIEWSFLSDFGKDVGSHDGVWECPDLVILNYEEEIKYLLIVNINPGGPAGGSATQYFIGDFDGIRFSSQDNETRWFDYGKDSYAGVTFSNTGDRHIFAAWMNNWEYSGEVPTFVWSGGLTLPHEISLIRDGEKFILSSKLIPEIEKFYNFSKKFSQKGISSIDLSPGFEAPFDIKLSIKQKKATRISLKLSSGSEFYSISLTNENKFEFDRTKSTNEEMPDSFKSLHVAPASVSGNPPDIEEWRAIVDVSSVEFEARNGRVSATDVVYPSKPFSKIELIIEGGTVDIDANITSLKSIYPVMP